MKRICALLLCVGMTLMLFSCGKAKFSSVEGTWYSITDATMYQFEDGKITVGGMIVGQYEQDGTTVILAFANDSSSMKRVITTSGEGVEVLVDNVEGEESIYLCRGYENAQRYMELAQQPSEKTAGDERQTEHASTPMNFDNLELYSDEIFEIYLNTISKEGIEFTFINKTDEILTIRDDAIALDGQCCVCTNGFIWEDIASNATIKCVLKCELSETEHSEISGSFSLVGEDKRQKKEVVFDRISLGGAKNLLWESADKSNILYEDDDLICSFWAIQDSMILVEIGNKSDTMIDSYVANIAINGKDIGAINAVNGINAGCTLPGTTSLLLIETDQQLAEGDAVVGVIQLFEDGIGTYKFDFTLTV